VQNSNCKNASLRHSPHYLTLIGVLSFILLVTAGLLALSSCATSPKGLAREQRAYNTTSNVLYAVGTAVPALPAPASQVLEGFLALGGALMAVWASHLHRTVRDIQNGSANGPAPGAPRPPSPAAG
jgi:hypothetical protein